MDVAVDHRPDAPGHHSNRVRHACDGIGQNQRDRGISFSQNPDAGDVPVSMTAFRAGFVGSVAGN
jgi:hypothetical protein